MTRATAGREAKIRSLTDQVGWFDPSNPVHTAHWANLSETFGELAAAMLVSQDAAYAANERDDYSALELTDAGQINTHPGWRKLNRVVKHDSVARYSIFDPKAETKVGGRLVPMFTRDQTVPAYMQED